MSPTDLMLKYGIEISTEAVLVVEDDGRISSYFVNELIRLGVPALAVDNIANADVEVRDLLSQGVQRLAILLDLMFEGNDPREGMDFLHEIADYGEFQEGKIIVIVRTASLDKNIRKEAEDLGVKEFHNKGREPEAALQDILLYLGKDVLIQTSLMEVVDIDEIKREAEVRYRTDNDRLIRCTLDYQFIPKPARIPGGSFRLEISKLLVGEKPESRVRYLAVDQEEDAAMLRDFLG